MTDQSDGAAAARVMALDAFGRIHELVGGVTSGLSAEQTAFRPDAEANSIGWLVWHLTRIQDDHLSGVADRTQVWTAGGWSERFGLPFDDSATGYGHSSDDVAAVVIDGATLAAYHADVHAFTVEFVDGLTAADLERVVDERWDPPVTLSVRIVSVLADCLEHLGQAAYVRGLLERSEGPSTNGAHP